MINRLVDISVKMASRRKDDPDLLARMEVAAKGQSPQFLLVSPIDRSSQDLQLLDMRIGDAFHATRVPQMPLLPYDKAPVLFAGPAAYNRGFREKRGVILTFEFDESSEVVRDSLGSIAGHPDLKGLPVIALKVDYEQGRARLEPHRYGRDYAGENWVLSRMKRPEFVDESLLVVICSDSRVHPPSTPEGLPMAIQTLGGYVPRFTGAEDESAQLNVFFENWLGGTEENRRILVVMHGSFRGEGPPCGAAHASLNPEQIQNERLRPRIAELREAASRFEQVPPRTAEDRVIALAAAIKENLLSYSPIGKRYKKVGGEFIEVALMNTVTNVLSPAGSQPVPSTPE